MNAIAYRIIGVARIILLILLTAIGLLVGGLSWAVPTKTYLQLASLWHFCVTKTVGVGCRFNQQPNEPGSLMVCNHVSWLDISVLGSKFPVVYLARSEIANWPILGWLIRKAGTLFIERGKGSQAAVKEIARALNRNQSVLIFPEGKTTDGSTVIRFQPRLFQSAIDSGVMIQPVAIRYINKAGQRVRRMSFDQNVSFLVSLWRTVCGPRIIVDIHTFEPKPTHSNRDALSQDAESCIKQWIERM